MIVNWKKPGAGLLVIPVVNLLPGHNDVPDDIWALGRKHCDNHLSAGNLVEIGEDKPVKVMEEQVNPETGKKEKVSVEKIVTSPLTLKKMSPQKAIEVVKDTYSLDTLNKWRKEETRDEIRAELLNQIELIEKGDMKAVESK